MRPITVSVSDASGDPKGSSLVRFDNWAQGPVSVQAVVTGTVSYSVEVSNDDPNDPVNPVDVASMTWSPAPDAGLVTQSVTKYGSLVAVPVFARVYLASGNGSVVTTFVQSSSVPQ